VATAVRQQADVVVRGHPATFPLETEGGQPCNVLRWLRHRGGAEREWRGWWRWAGQRYPVRLIAAKLDPTATRRARGRTRRKAQKAGRTLWALHENTTTLLRSLLSASTPPEMTVLSSWLLSGLGLDTLRQQVQGSWSKARLQACLPRLRRFLCSRPRRRVHQETTRRAWLEQRARVHSDRQRQGA